MLRVGLNPYGIAYSVGLHGKGTPRANPNPLGLAGYLGLAEEMGAQALELPVGLLADLSPADLNRLRERLEAGAMTPVLSQPSPVAGIDVSLRLAPALGARVIRMNLTSVLCGDRAAPDCRWIEIVTAVRNALKETAPRAADGGLILALENHQDFTSGELMELCVANGENIGVCLDTGNALAVGEDPLAFARTVAPRVRHVHLKDYRAQWTDQGYRLVRCAIGDGAVPFEAVAAVLNEHHESLTAAIEPGALNVRHIRLLTPGWWEGYPDHPARALAAGLAAARVRRLDETADWRTPWEADAGPEEIVGYEREMLHKSVANLRRLGLMQPVSLR